MVVTEFDNEKPVSAVLWKTSRPMVFTQSPVSKYLILSIDVVCDVKSPLVIADVESHSALYVEESEYTAENFIPVGGVGPVPPDHTKLPPQP